VVVAGRDVGWSAGRGVERCPWQTSSWEVHKFSLILCMGTWPVPSIMTHVVLPAAISVSSPSVPQRCVRRTAPVAICDRTVAQATCRARREMRRRPRSQKCRCLRMWRGEKVPWCAVSYQAAMIGELAASETMPVTRGVRNIGQATPGWRAHARSACSISVAEDPRSVPLRLAVNFQRLVDVGMTPGRSMHDTGVCSEVTVG